jgi:hypothetical protein
MLTARTHIVCAVPGPQWFSRHAAYRCLAFAARSIVVVAQEMKDCLRQYLRPHACTRTCDASAQGIYDASVQSYAHWRICIRGTSYPQDS